MAGGSRFDLVLMKTKTYLTIPKPIALIQERGTNPLVAFHGSAKLKAFYLNRVKAHQKADEIIHGIYWTGSKGCAVGCSVHSNQHSAYEVEMGIPRVLASLEDGIFEGLSNGTAKEWPVSFLESIHVGANLSMVFYSFMEWLLIDRADGVIRFAKTDAQRKAIQDVGDLFRRRISGEEISVAQWLAVRKAAAAYAAAYAAASYAAYAAAYAAARGQARIRQFEKLIELLSATKP